MIYFVDEDFAAYAAWMAELGLRGYQTQSLWNADEALTTLRTAGPDIVELVVIDVMLAVDDATTSTYTVERTDAHLETGLRLLEDLASLNPDVFPRRAVLLTNTTNRETDEAAQLTSRELHVPLWKKASIFSPVEFGDRVEELLGARAGV